MKNSNEQKYSYGKNLWSIPGITGIIVGLIGIALAIPGVYLISLGGSWYYLLAGIGLIISGWLFCIRRYEAICVYGVVFLATIIWAIYEVGFDGWKLMPRLFTPALLGIWMCLPIVTNRLLETHDKRELLRRTGWLGAGFCIVIAVGVIALGYHTTDMRYQKFGQVADAEKAPLSNQPIADGDWRFYGRTANGDRYSPLAQITPDNVSKLKLAWQFHTGDVQRDYEKKKGREFNFEVTPTKIGNNLYICTPHRFIFSLNATTGKKNWEFDTHSDTKADIFVTCRGVAYAETPNSKECPRRIISPAGDPRMVALNADTGKPCEDFGDHGWVSLTDHMGPVSPGFHFITSQPLVVNDRIILGGWIYDDQSTGEPSGVVRAYDPKTGKLAWAWDLGKTNPTEPVKKGETYTLGTPNAWGTYTADTKLGLVYLPMGNATPDYFGGKRRKFDDEYSSAVVALDIKTGKERWHFQTVHHDLWDFDLPIGPSLVDVKTDQGIVPALVQTTKRGEFFMLDRRTGKSLTKITEKPVPQNPVPGEYLSKTQPYPDMPSLAPAELSEKDTWGATPIDQLLCRIQFKKARYDGQFTPPTLGSYLAYPAFDGVMDWYGASIDPTRNLLVTNSNDVPFMMHYMKIEDAIKQGLAKPWKGFNSGQPYPNLISVANNPEYGTPYSIVITPWLNQIGVPCFAPPWGSLTAIDLNTRKIVWQRPLGTTADMGPFHTHIMPGLPTGIFSMGGAITTGSGLIFIGGTTDDTFRAFDETNGELKWETQLPAGGNATPVTYSGDDGKQYVVIAAGGHGGLQTKLGDSIMAYSLGQ